MSVTREAVMAAASPLSFPLPRNVRPNSTCSVLTIAQAEELHSIPPPPSHTKHIVES